MTQVLTECNHETYEAIEHFRKVKNSSCDDVGKITHVPILILMHDVVCVLKIVSAMYVLLFGSRSHIYSSETERPRTLMQSLLVT